MNIVTQVNRYNEVSDVARAPRGGRRGCLFLRSREGRMEYFQGISFCCLNKIYKVN